MKDAGAVPELLQPLRHDGPELAAGTFVHAAGQDLRRGDDVDGIAIEFADRAVVQVLGENFALWGDGDGDASGFGQAVGHSIDAPVGSALAPTCRDYHQKRRGEQPSRWKP